MVKRPFKLKISNRLKVLRAEKGISQQQLADAIGVTRATVLAIENNQSHPSIELAFRLALYFEVDIHSIFSLKTEPKRTVSPFTPAMSV